MVRSSRKYYELDSNLHCLYERYVFEHVLLCTVCLYESLWLSVQDPATSQEVYGTPANTLDPSISWKDVSWLQSLTRLPIIIKGVLTKEDAELAVEHGVQGIIVSNHGGRQLDGGPASVRDFINVSVV